MPHPGIPRAVIIGTEVASILTPLVTTVTHTVAQLVIAKLVENGGEVGINNSPGVTHDVPVPQAHPNEFPMSAPDFYAHFLSPEETKIVRIIKTRGPLVSSKTIAELMDQKTDKKYPNAVLSTTLRQLKDRGLLDCDDDGYRLSAYLISLMDRFPMPG